MGDEWIPLEGLGLPDYYDELIGLGDITLISSSPHDDRTDLWVLQLPVSG